MIKVEGSNVTISGSIPDLLTEFSLMVRGLIDSTKGKITRKDIERSVEIGFMTEEEVEKEFYAVLIKELTALKGSEGKGKPDVMRNLFKDMFGEE